MLGRSTTQGFAGNDYLVAGGATDNVWDNIWGGDGNDYMDAGNGGSQLIGGAGNDTIIGGTGINNIWGNEGVDIITTGSGADTINLYNYTAGILDSGVGSGNRDIVIDFDTTSGDKISIDVPNIYFLGTGAFTGKAGEIRFYVASNITVVQVDMNGDKNVDMEIELTGVKALLADDFSVKIFG